MQRSLLVMFAALLCVGPTLGGPKKAAKKPELGPEPRIVTGDPSPSYFPVVPDFPLPRELAYSEEISGIVSTRLAIKSYAVGDLVIPLPSAANGWGTEKVKTKEAELIAEITKKIAPKSWDKAGGKGTIEYFPLGLALIVNQTPEVHEAVVNYLETLRKVQDQQVSTQVLILTVSNDWFEKSGMAKELGISKESKPGQVEPKYLSAKEVKRLLTNCQEDVNTSVMQAPRMTLFSGQAGQVNTCTSESFVTGLSVQAMPDGSTVWTPKTEQIDQGVAMEVEPTVSIDGKEISVRIAASSKELAVLPVPMTPITTLLQPVAENGKRGEPAPFTQFIQHPKAISRKAAATVKIPNGGSALIYGGPASVERTVRDVPPILAEIPILCDLFARERKQMMSNHMLVLVTSVVVESEVIRVEFEECPKCDPKLSKLLGDYAQACKYGKVEDARRLAIECLVIDPTCFSKK
jgi:type II secretory pathway component GspD/PulD (secretin)